MSIGLISLLKTGHVHIMVPIIMSLCELKANTIRKIYSTLNRVFVQPKKEIIDNTHNKIGLVDNVENFAFTGAEVYTTFNDQSLTLYSGFHQPCFASTNKKPTTDLWLVLHIQRTQS